MASPELTTVNAHLRSLADRIMASPGDLERIRTLIDQYAQVHASVDRFEGTTVPVYPHDIPCEWVLTADSQPGSRLLYLHGGSWMSGSLHGYRAHAGRLAQATGCSVLMVDYRLAPEHPYPSGLDDCNMAFEWMCDHGPADTSPAASLFVAGDSAGGNLALALLLKRRDEKRTLPHAAVALSPATDLTWTSRSITERAAHDPILRPERIPLVVKAYVQGQAALTDPYVSPLYGNFTALPPLLLQTGEAEILLDDSVRLVEKVHQDGGAATLDVWPDMPHVFQMFAPYLPEATQALQVIGAFVSSSRRAMTR
jgi:epsilon-lactone hydrolase